jgi:hypothetical protein
LLAGGAEAAAPELPVTSLSLLGSCPLRWLLERRFGLRRLFEGRGEAWIPDEDREEGFGGAAFGSLLHAILERWDFHAEPQTAFDAACPADIDPARRAEAESILLTFFNPQQPWIQRLREAEDLRREETFVLDLGDVVLTGQIDLVFRWKQQRVLLDWKSDRVAGRHGVQERLDHHKLQLALYALALREAGQPADQALVAFLRANEHESKSDGKDSLRHGAHDPGSDELPAFQGSFRQVEIDSRQLEWAANKARKMGKLAAELSRLGNPLTPGDVPRRIPRPIKPPCAHCPFLDGLCPRAYRQKN